MRATIDTCTAKNWSAGQCGTWHGAGPRVSLKVPAAHAVHAPPFAPEKPVLHSHMELFGLAAREMELGGHVWHVPGPAPALYVPVAQAVHAAPLLPV